MGSYLPKPITDKESSDDSSDTLICGSSSMQGWRETQEDAHNCILDYDTDRSYFAVYDGHGGREVALYCSENLPEFLKQTEAYKNGDVKKALEDAFLEFDATITTPEVIEKLKKLVEDRPDIEEIDDDMVPENYESKFLHLSSENVKSSANKSDPDDVDNIVSSSSCTKKEANSLKSDASDDTKHTNSLSTKNCDLDEVQADSLIPKIEAEFPDSSVSKSKTCTVNNNQNNNKLNDPLSQHTGGVSSNVDNSSSCDNVTSSSAPSENGDVLTTDKTKTITEKVIKLTKFDRPQITAQELYKKFLELESSDEEESDDEEVDSTSPSEESSDEDEDDDDEENAKNSSNDENEKDDNDIVREFTCNMRDEPGFSSGCTAVVALLHENKLYVANAGDSRCIVCRNGKAVEMSFDHKPTNKDECKRINNAGGRVNYDGRVNNGLNLSRAIGDHAFKQNKDLSNREQMIIALPDVQTLTIDPKEDEFMVLACDGIWDYMSNQEVVNFIRPAIQEGKKKLSQICEEMLDYLHSKQHGDDNMTAIIVQFKFHVLKRPATEESNSSKRLRTEESSTVTNAV